jgi:hypothetical protein
MKKVNFLATCPGCGDTHVEVSCKKPTFITPVITKSFCDHCESTVLYRIGLPKNRESNRQVSVTPLKITASEKLVAILKAREAAKSEPITENV